MTTTTRRCSLCGREATVLIQNDEKAWGCLVCLKARAPLPLEEALSVCELRGVLAYFDASPRSAIAAMGIGKTLGWSCADDSGAGVSVAITRASVAGWSVAIEPLSAAAAEGQVLS